MQIEIVEVASSLSKATKAQPSLTIVGAFSDMMRHLRKSILCSVDDSELGEEVIQWNRKFYTAVDECLVQMSQKVKFMLLSSKVLNLCNFTSQGHQKHALCPIYLCSK